MCLTLSNDWISLHDMWTLCSLHLRPLFFTGVKVCKIGILCGYSGWILNLGKINRNINASLYIQVTLVNHGKYSSLGNGTNEVSASIWHLVINENKIFGLYLIKKLTLVSVQQYCLFWKNKNQITLWIFFATWKIIKSLKVNYFKFFLIPTNLYLSSSFVDVDGVELSSNLQGWLLVEESPFLLAQAGLTLLLLWR